MYSIGMDVHERTTSLCILDDSGRTVKEVTIKGHPRRAVEWLSRLDGPFQVCFEASTNYGWLTDQLERIGAKVVVAHPGRLRLIFRSRRKNDRLDAARLAKLLFLDEVPQVHVPSSSGRSWRGLIEHRERAIRERTRAKNGLRALLRSLGIQSPSHLWTKQQQMWLAELDLPELLSFRRDQLVDDVAYLTRKIDRVERKLDRIGRQHPAVALLMTIPGVGPRTAEAFVAYVDDPSRFRSRSIGAYFGLVPSQDASASVNHLGRITREGPSTVRKMLAEATWQAIRRSPRLRAMYERLCAERPERRKKAAVAIAHHLTRVMLAMMKTGEPWREEMPVRHVA